VPEILIVEDSEDDAILLERALRSAGIVDKIQCVCSGIDALAFLHSKQHCIGDDRLSVVFIDLKLPHTSGFEILRLMERRTCFAKTLRIVISSISDMESIRKAYSSGADSFIAKPARQFDIQELIRSFPDHWQLIDKPQAPPHQDHRPSPPEKQPSDAAGVLAQNRELIQKLRETLQALRQNIDDTDETIAIVENLTAELRSGSGPSQTALEKSPPADLIP